MTVRLLLIVGYREPGNLALFCRGNYICHPIRHIPSLSKGGAKEPEMGEQVILDRLDTAVPAKRRIRSMRARTLGEREIAIAAVEVARLHGVKTWGGQTDKELPVVEALWVNIVVTPNGIVGVIAESGKRHVVSHALSAIDFVPPSTGKLCVRWIDTLNCIRVITSTEIVVGPVEAWNDNSR
jgi:hypothetical protein